MAKCWHKNTKIIKRYRRNYPFGKKGGVKYYNPPQMCIEVCEYCGEEIRRWKP